MSLFSVMTERNVVSGDKKGYNVLENPGQKD